jgi:hypothetical protein
MGMTHGFGSCFWPIQNWAPRRGFDARSKRCRMPSSTARLCTPVRSAGRRRCSCYSVPARCLTLWCSLGKKMGGTMAWLQFGISQQKGVIEIDYTWLY